jgi:hypothetical protein
MAKTDEKGVDGFRRSVGRGFAFFVLVLTWNALQ